MRENVFRRQQTGSLLEQIDKRDRLDELKVIEIAAARFATLDGFDRERPAMAVRRGQNRGLKIGAQIIPQHGGLVGVVAVGRRDPQEILKAALQADAGIIRFELLEPSLNEIFIDRTTRA